MYKTWFHRQRDAQQGLPPESSNKASEALIEGAGKMHRSGGTTIKKPLEPVAPEKTETDGGDGEDTNATVLAALKKELQKEGLSNEDRLRIEKEIFQLEQKMAE